MTFRLPILPRLPTAPAGAALSVPVRRRCGRGRGRTGQRGVALLAVIAFLGIVAVVFVVRSLNADTLRADRDQRTTEALAQARQALLAYAAIDNVRPGALPCPDADGDGDITAADISGSVCAVYVGRLPHVRLGIPQPRDGSGEPLWYAPSPNFRDLGTIDITPNTVAQLSIAGGADQLVAVLFAPGPPLVGQIRTAANANAIANYLDGINALPTAAFSAQLPDDTFNDRLLAVSRADVMAVAEQRVAREVARALQGYFSNYGFLPRPADFADPTCVNANITLDCAPVAGQFAGRVPATLAPPHSYGNLPGGQNTDLLRGDLPTNWFQARGWREHVVYMVSAACVGPPATACTSGSLALRGNGVPAADDARFLLLMGGVPAGGQARGGAAQKGLLENYLENGALAAASALRAGATAASIVTPAGTVAIAAPPK